MNFNTWSQGLLSLHYVSPLLASISLSLLLRTLAGSTTICPHFISHQVSFLLIFLSSRKGQCPCLLLPCSSISSKHYKSRWQYHMPMFCCVTAFMSCPSGCTVGRKRNKKQKQTNKNLYHKLSSKVCFTLRK